MKLLLVVLFLFLICTSGESQSVNKDLLLLGKSNTPVILSAKKKSFTLNPLRLTYQLGINFYQKAISEQLATNCAFELTCSRFSKAMVNDYGLLKGYFLTFDRLGRCNVISPLETFPIRLNAQGKIIESTADFHFH